MLGFSRTFSRLACTLASCVALATALSGCGDDNAPTTPTQQSIKHIFVLTMENKDFLDTFAQSTQDPDLQNIAKQGALLREYYGTGHVSLDNYLAMMGGQPSTFDTATDCTGLWSDIVNAGWDAANPKVLVAGTDANGHKGGGCVYPKEVKTFVNQLDDIGVTWKGYMGDMGNDLNRDGTKTCSFPTRTAQLAGKDPAKAVDGTQSAQAASPSGDKKQDQYATRHNPFMYFHSIIDNLSYCDAHVVPLDDASLGLQHDLQSIATTPNFVFITPNLCDDGHDGASAATGTGSCVSGAKGGLYGINDFVKKWVAIIQASPAYQQDGLIIINFDESDVSKGGYTPSLSADGTTENFLINAVGDSCCGQVVGPNVTRPGVVSLTTVPVSAGGAAYAAAFGVATLPSSVTQVSIGINYLGFGGDRTGAVLLSKWIKPGTISDVSYNHYSLLRSLENIFQTNGYLGYADDKNLTTFGPDVFNNLQ